MNLIKKHHSKILGIFTLTAILLTVVAFWPTAPQILKWLLSAILILSGGMVFWPNKEKWEATLEESEGKTAKHKKGNRIYILILILLVAIAFGLRVANLDTLEPYDDEYTHMVSAMAINDHGSATIWITEAINKPYERSQFLTYLIAFLFAAFGKSLFLARLSGVIVSSLTTLPLYFLGKRFNKPIGLLMAGLWTFSPWAIGAAKNVREYAYFPFFYALIGLFLIVFLKNLIQIIEKKDWKITPKRFFMLVVFLLPVLYSQIDVQSTFKLVLWLYGVFFILFFYNLLRSHQISSWFKKRIKIFLLILIPVFAIAYFQFDHQFIRKVPEFSRFWFDLILGRSDATFFYGGNVYGFYLLFALAIVFGVYQLIKNKSQVFNFLFLSFIGYFTFFNFFLAREHHPRRYGIVMHLWLIPLLAIAIYLLYKLYLPQKGLFRRTVISIILFIFLLTAFNPNNIAKATNLAAHRRGNGSVAITTEYHERFLKVLEKYGDEIEKDTYIVCSLCNPFYWYEKVDLMENNIYYYAYYDEKRFDMIHYVTETKPSGLMILEWKRNRIKGLPLEDFKYGSEENGFVEIQFVERLGDFLIYRW